MIHNKKHKTGGKMLKQVFCSVLAATMAITPSTSLMASEKPVVSISAAAAENIEAVADRVMENVVNKTETVRQFKERKREPLMGGYFRTWYDVASTGTNDAGEEESHNGVNSMAEVPAEVDLLLVFHDWTSEKSPFWDKLKNEYVPKLNKQGTKVIRTIGAGFLTGEVGISVDKEKYPNNEEGYKKLAKDIVDTYVYAHNLDGLDIDVERHNDPYRKGAAEFKQAVGVIKEIAKLIGENGKDNTKFFILDTTLHAGRDISENYVDRGPNNGIFNETAQYYDYVLTQVYGPKGEKGIDENGLFGRDYIWNTFRDKITPDKLLIGFTFYEDGGKAGDNYWGDTEGGIENSRAMRYAKWQPKGGLKGGIFSYAIDRDGVEEGNDNKYVHTDYTWTKELKRKMMEQKPEYEALDEADFADEALRAEVAKQIGDFKGNIDKFDGELVLKNPAITSLAGLEKMTKLRKLTLKGLSGLTVLDKANLPESLKKVSTAPREEEDETLVLSELTGLQELNLSDFGLERLPEDADTWQALTRFDISANALDLSEETEDGKIVREMIKHVMANGGTMDADVKLAMQKPNAYYPQDYMFDYKEEIQLDLAVGGGQDTYDISRFSVLSGQRTIGGTYLMHKDIFDHFKKSTVEGVAFVDPSMEYGDFVIVYDMGKKFMLETKDHTNSAIDESYIVPATTAGQYSFEFYTRKPVKISDTLYQYVKDKKIHEVVVTVGQAPEALINIASNAQVLDLNFNRLRSRDKATLMSNASAIFDGVIDGEPRFKAQYYDGWIAFKVSQDMEATRWSVYNDTAVKSGVGPSQGQEDYNTKSGKLLYLNVEPTEEQLKDSAFLSDTSNWTEADKFDNNQTNDVYHGEFTAPIKSLYWRYDITETNPDAFFKVISIPELQIFGNNSGVRAGIGQANEIKTKLGKNFDMNSYFDIDLSGSMFQDIKQDMQINDWIQPKVDGIKFVANVLGARKNKLRVQVMGMPENSVDEALTITIPQANLLNGENDLVVSNKNEIRLVVAEENTVDVVLPNKVLELKVNQEANESFEVNLQNGNFERIYEGMDITNWVYPYGKGLRYVVTDSRSNKLVVSISGTPAQAVEKKHVIIEVPAKHILNGKESAQSTGNLFLNIVVENNTPIAPYVPAPADNNTVVIAEEKVALLAADKALEQELTKNISQEADKAVIAKFVSKQMTGKELVKVLSDKALNEYAQEVSSQFKDEKAANWYAKELSAVRLLQLVKGYEDMTFRANNDVTGKEMVTFLVRLANLSVKEEKGAGWFTPYQQVAEKEGLLKGVGFDLAKPLSRQEVAYLAYNFLSRGTDKAPAAKAELKATDKADISAEFVNAVTYLYESEILKGYEDNTYKPNDAIKRSEMVAILYRLLKK